MGMRILIISRHCLHQVNANDEKHSLHDPVMKECWIPRIFGRVDFIYEGEDEPEIFYIGIGSFSRKKRWCAADL